MSDDIDIKTKKMREINEYDSNNGDEMTNWDRNINLSDLYGAW